MIFSLFSVSVSFNSNRHRMEQFQGNWRLFIALGALAGILAVVMSFALAYQAVNVQAESDETRKADVIIVLGSAVWPGERPSPSLRARTLHAIDLYQRGYAPQLFFSGAQGQWPPAEAEVMRRLAAAAGVPSGAMILDTAATSTEETIQNGRALMAQQGWRSALIVSEPFHVYRAKLMAQADRIEAYASPAYDSPLYRVDRLRRFYTAREALGVLYFRLTSLPFWRLT